MRYRGCSRPLPRVLLFFGCRPPGEGQAEEPPPLPPADDALLHGVVGCVLARLQLALEGAQLLWCSISCMGDMVEEEAFLLHACCCPACLLLAHLLFPTPLRGEQGACHTARAKPSGRWLPASWTRRLRCT